MNNPFVQTNVEFQHCPGVGEDCWIWWDEAEEEGMGDDTIWGRVWVQNASVTLFPGASGRPLRFDATNASVEHDFNHRVNRTWVQMNESRPEELERVEFQSRWKRTDHEKEWGIHLYVRHEELPQKETGVFSHCWSICQLDYNDVPYTDYDSVRVARNGEIWSGNFHLDREVRSKHWELNRCLLGVWLPRDTCFWGAWAAAQWFGPQQWYLSTFPDVHITPGIRALAVGLNRNETRDEPPATNTTPLATGGGPVRGISAQSWQPHAAAAAPAALASIDPAHVAPPTGSGPPPPGVLELAGGSAAPASDPDAGARALIWFAAGAALFLGFLLYTRLGRAAILRHPLRRAILDLLNRQPGLRIGEVAAEMGLEYNLAKYHLRKLAGTGAVELVGSDRPVAFPAGLATPQAIRAAAIAQGPGRRLLDLLETLPEVDLVEAVRLLGLPRSTVVDTVRRLAAMGLLELGAGRPRRLRRVALAELTPV